MGTYYVRTYDVQQQQPSTRVEVKSIQFKKNRPDKVRIGTNGEDG